MSGPTDADLIAGLREIAGDTLAASKQCSGDRAYACLQAHELLTRAADRLAALTAAGAWTDAVPTERGWYWWRRDDREPEVVLVEPLHWTAKHAYSAKRVDGYEGLIESFGGEWRGPLSPDAPPPVPAEVVAAAQTVLHAANPRDVRAAAGIVARHVLRAEGGVR